MIGPSGRDVGSSDETDRTTDRAADRQRGEHGCQREPAGADDDQRAFPLRESVVAVDRDVPAQTGQRPDPGDEVGIAAPVVDHVTRRIDHVVVRAAGSTGERARGPTGRQADDVGETVHHAAATRAGVCTTLGQL